MFIYIFFSFLLFLFFFFFFNDTATTEIYTLSLHDALPILLFDCAEGTQRQLLRSNVGLIERRSRSEEHTSELQSRPHLVCRLLLEKKKKKKKKKQIKKKKKEKKKKKKKKNKK